MLGEGEMLGEALAIGTPPVEEDGFAPAPWRSISWVAPTSRTSVATNAMAPRPRPRMPARHRERRGGSGSRAGSERIGSPGTTAAA